MRWPTRKPLPAGLERHVVRFAWLPVALDTGLTVWLERYVAGQVTESWPCGVCDDRHVSWATVRRLPLESASIPQRSRNANGAASTAAPLTHANEG